MRSHFSSGLLAGALAGASARWRIAWLGFAMLTPLAFATYMLSPFLVMLSAAIAGAIAAAAVLWGTFPFMRVLEFLNIALTAMLWGIVFGIAAWAWPANSPSWGLLIVPASAVLVSLVPGIVFGRQAVPLLRTQERALAIVHIARLGHELVVVALLGLAASLPVLLGAQGPVSSGTLVPTGVGLAILVGTLFFGARSRGTSVRCQESRPSLRVGAVAVDRPPRTGGMFATMTSGEVADVIGAYAPRVAEAAARGARVIVMPEMAAVVGGPDVSRWRLQLSEWAQAARAIIVAQYFDTDQRRNILVIVSERGEILATYDKQHPVRGIEQGPPAKMPPAFHEGVAAVSGVICYDLDYGDWVRPVARRGGILAAPSNDWKEVADAHNRVTVWAAVLGGVPIIRATTHGISSIFDAAGRMIAHASSFDGPVVLVADVPIDMDTPSAASL
ncbi:MAG: nitrilase-related carbon-nitrogen hydrolase [Paludibaculum sp.]